jgi:hypothetical protein
VSGPTRSANPCRLVRCSAGCGRLVWLAGALPVAGDATFVCSTCSAAAPAAPDQTPSPAVSVGAASGADRAEGHA